MENPGCNQERMSIAAAYTEQEAKDEVVASAVAHCRDHTRSSMAALESAVANYRIHKGVK